MLTLSSKVRFVKGIGQQRSEALGKLGIFTVEDLIQWFPRSYEDRSTVRELAEIQDGESACIHAEIITAPMLTRIRDNMVLLRFQIADDSGLATVTVFNQPYLKNSLGFGKKYAFFGQFRYFGTAVELSSPIIEPLERTGALTGRIVPIYSLGNGITQNALCGAISNALEAVSGQIPELLPAELVQRRGLISASQAYHDIHIPDSLSAAQEAGRRLVYEELFMLALSLAYLKLRSKTETKFRIAPCNMERFYHSLPFSLTDGQKNAIADAVQDMSSGVSMNRLIQGDVGSGKTMIAAACIWAVVQSGCQAAFMAPTELLAEQHYSTLSGLLASFSVRVELLTGSTKAAERRRILEQLQSGETDLLIGTHALISETVRFRNLALAITDEQHRFGVMQRAALEAKGENPHILVMSATPIPRTLALMLYGDMDVSQIRELPPGRQQVETYTVKESMRPRIRKFAEKLISEGRQVYVVCPMIEDASEAMQDLNSAKTLFAELHAEMPAVRMALLHGKLKASEKEQVMSKFVSGEIQLLVSTTVVEVGVDVPNAALIVIENAERFGLSQLHQLRGRVGRGEHQSYCVLIQGGSEAENAARLKIIAKNHDGYKIAEEDLKLRGPGDFFGKRQSGLPEMKLAVLPDSLDVLTEAQNDAAELLRVDSALQTVPLLRQRIETVFSAYIRA